MYYTISDEEYVSVNSLTSQPVGTDMFIYPATVNGFRVILSDTQPAVDDAPVLKVSSLKDNFAEIKDSVKEVWIKAFIGGNAGISVVTDDGLYLSGIDGGLAGVVTAQTFTEKNVKEGLQYEFTNYIPSFASVTRTIITTGSKPVLVKGQDFNFNGLGLITQWHKNPTYTGGTVAPYFNRNFETSLVGELVILGGAVVTLVGDLVGAPQVRLGSTLIGNRVTSTSTLGQGGLDFTLAPNTTYCVTHTSLDTSAQILSIYSTWYEGDFQ